MAASTAVKALGTTLKMKGVSTFESIGDITSLEIPGFTTDIIDVTHLQSDGKEKLAGIVDHGQLNIVLNWVPGSTTQGKIDAAAGLLKEFQIAFASPSTVTYEFKAIVATWKPAASTPTGVQSGSLTLEVSGALTIDDGVGGT